MLMNTRGLTEIVILTVGLEQAIITPTLFTMMVIMALVTTFMAAPALRLLGVSVTAPRSVARRRGGASPDGLRPV